MRFSALDDRLIAHLKDRGAQRILDVGCGNGRFANRAALAGLDVTGIDPFVIPSRGCGFQFLKTRLQDYSPDGHFDAAVLSFTLHSISAYERVELGRDLLLRHLKPDGLIAVVDYQKPELTPLNCFLWLSIWVDEVLTIIADGNTHHLRNFQNYVSHPIEPHSLGLTPSTKSSRNVSLMQLAYPALTSVTEVSVEIMVN